VTEAPEPSAGVHHIRMDLEGRLRNTKVPANEAFLPTFEAVVNSIHSTEDRFGVEVSSRGRIEVHVHRVPQQHLPGPGRPPIELVDSFEIVDNGIGFTNANMASFETADSTAKLARGGKGIGRLTWLVVFHEAKIKSTFEGPGGGKRHRSFTFSPTPDGITDYEEEEAPAGAQVETRISLLATRSDYAELLRRGGETIADRIFEHCFNYFVLDRCPRVLVVDHAADGTTQFVVNDRAAEIEISTTEPLCVGGHNLHLRHVKQRHSTGKRHLGHLLANDRVVSSFALSEVSDLGNEPIRTAEGEAQVHHVFVAGPALDEAADASRTHFNLPDGQELIEATGLLDLRTLRQEVGAAVDAKLVDVLRKEREENLRRIETYIRTQQPEYTRLLSQRPEQLARVKWTDNPKQLDAEIYRVRQSWDLEIRQQQSEVEQKLIEKNTELEEIADKLYKVVADTNLAGQDDLVRYVVRRRAVLQLLGKMLSRFQGKVLEKHIHKIVFPLKKNNGEIDYEDHNLWLVDDMMSFYEYVSSDVPLVSNEQAPSDSKARPDILAFKTGDPLQHISMVEFKRPDRDDENPVMQLVKYAQLLRKGGATGANGITLPGIPMSVRIDAYAVVTLTPKMEELLAASPGEVKKVEGEWRWYGTVSNFNMTVEVLDFRAFVSRAEQRHRAFFRKLGLS
jgi:hypothetical protein